MVALVYACESEHVIHSLYENPVDIQSIGVVAVVNVFCGVVVEYLLL